MGVNNEAVLRLELISYLGATSQKNVVSTRFQSLAICTANAAAQLPQHRALKRWLRDVVLLRQYEAASTLAAANKACMHARQPCMHACSPLETGRACDTAAPSDGAGVLP